MRFTVYPRTAHQQRPQAERWPMLQRPADLGAWRDDASTAEPDHPEDLEHLAPGQAETQTTEPGRLQRALGWLGLAPAQPEAPARQQGGTPSAPQVDEPGLARRAMAWLGLAPARASQSSGQRRLRPLAEYPWAGEASRMNRQENARRRRRQHRSRRRQR